MLRNKGKYKNLAIVMYWRKLWISWRVVAVFDYKKPLKKINLTTLKLWAVSWQLLAPLCIKRLYIGLPHNKDGQ